MQKLPTVLLAGMLAVSACKKDKDKANSTLEGKWLQVARYGLQTPGTDPSIPFANALILNITTDSIILHRADTLVYAGKYALKTEQGAAVITFSPDYHYNNCTYSISHDSLFISGPVNSADFPTDVYIKRIYPIEY
jgi:hypothetical protein